MNGKNGLKKLNPEAKVVFIGPCIAKKAEAKEKDLEGVIDFVLTYAELDAYIRDGIEPNEEVKAKIDSMHEKNLFKLQPMPSFVYQA